jgi:hypothetical protein
VVVLAISRVATELGELAALALSASPSPMVVDEARFELELEVTDAGKNGRKLQVKFVLKFKRGLGVIVKHPSLPSSGGGQETGRAFTIVERSDEKKVVGDDRW